MKLQPVALTFIFVLLFGSCRCVKEVDCYDPKILPAFIGFQLSEIDTLIVTKYKTGENFRTPIDSFTVVYGDNFRISNDTTKVNYYPFEYGIATGFDWQIFIPAINRTVRISEILSNKKTVECPTLTRNCGCANDLFSANIENQTISFVINDREPGPFFFLKR